MRISDWSSDVCSSDLYAVVIRNLSTTGALIEGILDVPVGTRFVIDFGEGQLVTATVRRSAKHQQGIEFEQTMVSDGNGGLCTRHRVSPYLIASAAQQTWADRKRNRLNSRHQCASRLQSLHRK